MQTNTIPDTGKVVSVPSPPCIIYKTRSDYRNLVPVTLTADKSAIVSFPDIKDIYYHGKLSYPDELSQGFLLDNRGIGPDVAFLNITYEEYSKYPHTPPAAELFKRILDKDPLLEMYQCGLRSRYSDPVAELVKIIDSGDLSGFKKLK